MIKVSNYEKGIKSFYIERQGYKLTLLNVGAAIWKLETPNKNNEFGNIVISFKDPSSYLLNRTYQGSIVGRNAGRIDGASFVLNGKTIKLPSNDGTNNLHSSGNGVSRRLWDYKINDSSIEFSIHLSESDDGFPGNIDIKVIYEFNDTSFKVNFFATSDKDTICNLTDHTYFNLSSFKEKVLHHNIENTFSNVWALTDQNIPFEKKTSESIFGSNKRIKDIILNNQSFFKKQRGFDHPFELDNKKKIIVSDSKEERKLTIKTSYPYAVIYTQNWEEDELDNKLNEGLAVECQYLPNEINICKKPGSLLLKNKTYSEWIEYSFE